LIKRFGKDEDAFSVNNMSAITDALSSVNDTLTLLLGGIAAYRCSWAGSVL
jgi:putative ABC transport system permease protein